MTTGKLNETAHHRPDDERPDSHIPEAPDVPEGGIPDLDDDSGKDRPDRSSSEKAQDEQDRQLESGEENPV